MAHESREKAENGGKEVVTIRNVLAIGRWPVFSFSIDASVISNRSVASSGDESR